MNVSERRGVQLRWGAVLAGAVVAVATAWAGELLGSLLGLIEPGESSAWGWLGSVVALAMVVAGAFAGGWIASRLAGARERTDGLLHGLVVWGVFGTASAMLFAILGGNLALVAGSTAGAVRLAVGFAMLGLFGALLGAAAGGTLGASEQHQRMGRGRRSARVTGQVVRPPAEAQSHGPEVYTAPPTERRDVPPSVH
jgi:MFS family permease